MMRSLRMQSASLIAVQASNKSEGHAGQTMTKPKSEIPMTTKWKPIWRI
jgi:hypothetical protein